MLAHPSPLNIHQTVAAGYGMRPSCFPRQTLVQVAGGEEIIVVSIVVLRFPTDNGHGPGTRADAAVGRTLLVLKTWGARGVDTSIASAYAGLTKVGKRTCKGCHYLHVLNNPRSLTCRPGVATRHQIPITSYFALGRESDIGAARTCLDGASQDLLKKAGLHEKRQARHL